MARDLYISKGLSAATIEGIAKATRSLCDISEDEDFDILHFLEVDILRIFPDFYLFVEEDFHMDGSQAFVTEDSTGIVVAESVYNDARAGLFYARKILAHEFGHVLLHHNRGYETKHSTRLGYVKQLAKMDTFNSAEWQADTYAILLLLPTKHRWSEAELRQKYKISVNQAKFVASRIESIRRRSDTYSREDVISVLETIKYSCNVRAEKPEYQYSFFA
ncbi:ImmA/IrrE family metallo-endopeptidase [Rhizobium leguminosarum]|uniref:ImmA/IrrE family metallo-endopeptidase n=1 Tax=Rhizobium leguminosarum TaxID=384 RepID=UPI0010300914|nr:ImmA/IrrE family metallo-endopeptidase [Rhizobium leguminosarum]TAY98407.1 ImmA/IrrE family metallo-endopeptidase [Rhizobium leguminosarum]TAZ09172.1 ImmA/IrrE family metallo-endopeptidase [Rhizobium leguminosarum]